MMLTKYPYSAILFCYLENRIFLVFSVLFVSSQAKIPPYFLLAVSIFDCNYLQKDITCGRDIENQKG
jgi:hypothetical protein